MNHSQQQHQSKKVSPQAFVMPPEPANISSQNPETNHLPNKAPAYPTMQASPSMIHAIKSAPKGKLPPGLAKYLASHKKGGKK